MFARPPSLLLLVGVLLLPWGAGAAPPSHFAQAKGLLTRMYQELALSHPEARETFYCRCQVDASGRQATCPQDHLQYRGNPYPIRETQVSWEHLLPANHLEQALGVNREQPGECRPPGNFGPRPPAWETCDSPEEQARVTRFKALEADPYNLVPATMTANRLRSNHPLTPLTAMPPEGCPLVIIKTPAGTWQTQIAPERLGFVARTYLYLAESYPELHLREQLPHQEEWESWNRQHPASAFECARHAWIQAHTGLINLVMDQACSGRGLVEQKQAVQGLQAGQGKADAAARP